MPIKTMNPEEYYYYKDKTLMLLVALKDWLHMVAENNVKVGIEEEVELAQKLLTELREHYDGSDGDIPSVEDSWFDIRRYEHENR